MGLPYDPHEVEARWRARWEDDRLYQPDVTAGPDYYNLAEFPYPSAAGLHVGHVFKYCGLDVYGRYQRMRGREVFQPIGFDSFGINAENYALKLGRYPAAVIDETIANFRRQLSSVGIGWDWSREIVTSDPSYYRWTQWIFVQLFRAGLAYQAEAPVIWCPSCATVLAREQTVHGVRATQAGHGVRATQAGGDRCERCDTPVAERVLTQWFLRMTAYADRLRDGLAGLDWPERAKRLQRNWIDGLRDWNISRQRYWGPPIPIVHCPACGPVAVPEAELPVPLGRDPHTVCPSCGGPARRETDVSDTFFDSSWYFLRYPCTEIDDRPWDVHRIRPVDFYAGGPEHVQRHHLYARFVTMALHDLGLVPFEEPFPRIRLGGIITMDGAKMSKSRGNVVGPDELLAVHGSDVTRLHLLFSGPWEQGGEYRASSVAGVERFLARAWRLESKPDPVVDARTIQQVTDAIERLRFNVAVAALMEAASRLPPRTLVRLLAPLAPHVAEELWARLGEPYSVHTALWPEAAAISQTVTLVVQVDGKVRDRIAAPAQLDEPAARALALASPRVRVALAGRPVRRTVHVIDRVVNLVVAP
ncbi:MAG: class I tRNA ligase family protein [Acidimicrobiales bacterium]